MPDETLPPRRTPERPVPNAAPQTPLNRKKPTEHAVRTPEAGLCGNRPMLDISGHLVRRSRIAHLTGLFAWKKSNIRSVKGEKSPVSCTTSNRAARGQVGYWTDYMTAWQHGRRQCRVLDGLLGGLAAGTAAI